MGILSGCIKMIKSKSVRKDIYNVTERFVIQKNVYLAKNLEKMFLQK